MIPSRGNPLIRTKKYLTQFGQLKTMGRTKHGDVVLTSTATVACLVYQETSKQDQTNPAVSLLNEHRALLPTSIRTTTSEGDHIAQVTDRFGNVVLDDARIVKIIDYNHWRHEPRFFAVRLDLDLD